MAVGTFMIQLYVYDIERVYNLQFFVHIDTSNPSPELFEIL